MGGGTRDCNSNYSAINCGASMKRWISFPFCRHLHFFLSMGPTFSSLLPCSRGPRRHQCRPLKEAVHGPKFHEISASRPPRPRPSSSSRFGPSLGPGTACRKPGTPLGRLPYTAARTRIDNDIPSCAPPSCICNYTSLGRTSPLCVPSTARDTPSKS